MPKNQPKYTSEFKLEAVRSMERRGSRTVGEVAKELGLTAKQLFNWRAALKRRGALPHLESKETAEEELKRLRRENRELKMEREILKKAATFFAKESE